MRHQHDDGEGPHEEGCVCGRCSDADARALADMRALDAWAGAVKGRRWECEPGYCSLSFSVPMAPARAARLGQPSGTIDGAKSFPGDTPDDARHLAAAWARVNP